MNSWGTNWGEDGFVKFEAVAGAGICGMNQDLEWVKV